MKMLTIAAGVAVGYVLGTRAGRGKYEQIADSARRLRDNPSLGQLQQAARDLTTPPSPNRPAQVTTGTSGRTATGTA